MLYAFFFTLTLCFVSYASYVSFAEHSEIDVGESVTLHFGECFKIHCLEESTYSRVFYVGRSSFYVIILQKGFSQMLSFPMYLNKGDTVYIHTQQYTITEMKDGYCTLTRVA